MATMLVDSTPVTLLKNEHRILQLGLAELVELLERRTLGQRILGRDSRDKLRARLTRFHNDLVEHFRHEEEGFFHRIRQALSDDPEEQPLLHEFFNSEKRYDLAAHRILVEHVMEMLSLLDELGRGVRIGGVARARLVTLMKDVHHILERHVAAEDGFVYPMGEEMLSTAAR